MKAIVRHDYGLPDLLRLEEIDRPTAGDDEVLVKVHAASINPADWHFMTGKPYLIRIGGGLRRPKDTRLGIDVAGRVEAVGRNVTKFEPGDEVFGACRGAFAEYACTSESSLVKKPDSVTFEQAASAPVAALTALQGLRDRGRIRPGQTVLINGAAGGVGTFAVQIARSFGTEVTGVCSSRNVDMVRSIGADHVVDYTQEDFTRTGQRYDLILDCVGTHSLSELRRALMHKGTLVLVGGPDEGNWLGPLVGVLEAVVLSRFVSQNLVMVLAKLGKGGDMAILRDLMAARTVIPVIDRRYSLAEVPDGMRYLEKGHARGKVIVAVDPIGMS